MQKAGPPIAIMEYWIFRIRKKYNTSSGDYKEKKACDALLAPHALWFKLPAPQS